MSVSALETAVAPLPRPASSRPTTAIAALLEQLQDVITLLPPSVFVARPAARVSGSVGEHVRHAIDHVAALVAALGGEALSYDSRLRGTTVEVNPNTAVDEIQRLLFRLATLDDRSLDRPVTLTTLIDPDWPSLAAQSTVGRELAFVVQHTIHHCALIALLLEWQGVRVPRGFGVAPSTVRARKSA